MLDIIFFIEGNCTHLSGCGTAQHSWEFLAYTGTIFIDTSAPVLGWTLGSQMIPVSGAWEMEDVSVATQFGEGGFKRSDYEASNFPQVGVQYYLTCFYGIDIFDASTDTSLIAMNLLNNAIKMEVNNYAKYK